MDLAVDLLAQAVRYNERRLIVLSGTPENTYRYTAKLLDSIDVTRSEATYVGPSSAVSEIRAQFHCECLDYDQTPAVMGTTRRVVVLDCHSRCEPNHLGQLVGAVDGGGLFVLLTPPLSTWGKNRDEFDESLAVPPHDVSSVTGRFKSWLVTTLRQHRGVALFDCDRDRVEKDGRTECHTYLPEKECSISSSEQTRLVPEDRLFLQSAYDSCLTSDQQQALATFETLMEPDTAVVLEANRGRGKSSVAGIAAGCLALEGKTVIVTGPQYRRVETLLTFARRFLEESPTDVWTDSNSDLRRIHTSAGDIRYLPSETARNLPADTDAVFVDEAAALPVSVLEKTLEAPSVAYITTTHGYEGAGRGFSVRFRNRLAAGPHCVSELQITTPIRYASGDPVEVWSFRALSLDARPPVTQVVADATPDSVSYRILSGDELQKNEVLRREVFGLLVLAHYRTEPNDLARLLDAPNISVHALFQDDNPVSVALLSREGALSSSQRRRIYEGERIRGNVIPDVLTSQLRDERAGETVGDRILRITTHSELQSRGLGSLLLKRVTEQAGEMDWLGVSYGATPALLEFWSRNGFAPVHFSTTRNDRSGEHSAIMLRPLSPVGDRLLARHSEWFYSRFPETLSDTLRDVDPDVIRAVCRSLDHPSQPELSDWEWRHTISVGTGPSIFELAPGPVRRLAFYGLTDRSGLTLSPRQQRLLVMRVLQLRPTERVANELAYDSESSCMRDLGRVVSGLVDTYAPERYREERRRFRDGKP